VYDLERRTLLWVGEDRTEEAVRPFFIKEMGRRRCHTLQIICMDMWAPYAKLVKQHAPQAQIPFDRFHIVKHLNEAVEDVRRSEMRRLSQKERVAFKRIRWLLLKNPWNLSNDEKERLSTLVRWEHADGAGLLPQRSVPTVLGVPPAQARPRSFGEVDALGHAFTAGALQEIRAHAPQSFRWNSGLDQNPSLQRRGGGNEQQD
jgi:hypothetical protein